MKSRSNVTDLSNASAEKVLSENGATEKGINVYSISYKKTGYGHWLLSAELIKTKDFNNSVSFSTTTTNSNLIDDWGKDEIYFQDDNSGHWYNNNEEVMCAALDEILRNDVNNDNLQEWATYPE